MTNAKESTEEAINSVRQFFNDNPDEKLSCSALAKRMEIHREQMRWYLRKPEESGDVIQTGGTKDSKFSRNERVDMRFLVNTPFRAFAGYSIVTGTHPLKGDHMGTRIVSSLREMEGAQEVLLALKEIPDNIAA